jgi:hypothetical protein
LPYPAWRSLRSSSTWWLLSPSQIKPKEAGQKIGMSPVKKLALGLGIPVLQPRRVADPQFIKLMQDLRPDLCVVVAFGQKIPDTLLELPPFGCINLHSSLLPKYRGAAPINKAIAEGDGVTGVTTMYLSSEWDAGDIILQAEEPILPEDTGWHAPRPLDGKRGRSFSRDSAADCRWYRAPDPPGPQPGHVRFQTDERRCLSRL